MYAHAPAGRVSGGLSGVDAFVRVSAIFDDLLDQVRHWPEVDTAAGVMGLPTGQYDANGRYEIEGRRAPGGEARQLPSAGFRLASASYFATLRIPLVRGRDFDDGDRFDRPFVAIVSESLARQSFPGQDPIGHTIQCGLESPKWMTIVGVVADVRQDSPASSAGPTLYMPLRQYPFHGNEIHVVMRTAVSPTSLIEPVRSRMHTLNPEVATRFTTLEAMVSDSIATPRLRTALVGVFAGLALLLAIAGMYGVMSYVTTQRVAEFGVRVALGASPRDVLGLVLGGAVRLTLAGVFAGLAIAAAVARVLNAMLFGLEATDAVTYAGVLLAVTPIIVLAAALPAWRASRADPVIALRSE